MVTIGETAKIKIYLVRAANYKPSALGNFIDYTGFFGHWKIGHNLNNLAYFDGEAYGNMDQASPSGSGTRKDDIKYGNYIYVLAGNSTNALIGKFRIQKPIYESSYKVRITAIQSTGTEALYKAMYSRNAPKTQYKNETLSTIFEGVGALKGICIDENGIDIISVGSMAGSTDRYSLSTDYENRIDAVSKACNISQKEWLISHGTNSGTVPYSTGDEINILNRIGNAVSVKTFYLSGANQNAKLASGTTEIDTPANHVIAKGRDIQGNQIQVEVYDAATTKTYVTQTIDGWLANDITAITGTFALQPGHGLAGLGDIVVKIDSELIAGSVTGDTFTVTTRGSNMGSTITTNTVPAPHKAGSDVLLTEDTSISIFGSSRITIYVFDDTKVPAAGITVWIGNEKMVVISKSAGQFIAERFGIFNSWAQPYAHSLVNSRGPDVFSGVYTPYNPETTTGNSIYDNGLITKELTDNSCLTKDSLEKKAWYMLNSKKDPTQRIALEVSDPINTWISLALGDAINLQNTLPINITAGDYRVVEYEFSGPFPELLLYINDPDTRGWTISSYDFMEEMDSSETIKQQTPIRGSDEQRTDFSTTAGNPLGEYSPGPTALQNVVVPKAAWGAINPSTWLTNDYDSAAANVGFVRAQISGAGGYWAVVGGDLRPIASYDIESYGGIGSGEAIGTLARPWDYGYFGQAICTSSCWVGGWRFIDVLGDFLVQYIAGPLTFMTYRPQTGGSIPNQIRCDVIFKNYSATSDVAGLSAGHEGLTYFNTVTNKLRIYNGSVWADVGGGASLWETSGTGIRPITSNDDVLPNGVANLGTGIAIWSGMYIRGNIQSAADVYIYMTTTGISINRIRDGLSYGITFDTSSNEPAWRIYGASQNIILTRLAGTGWIYLDAITSISGDCQPTTTLVYSLGDPAYIWKNFHISRIYMYDLALITTTQPLTITSGSGDTIITAYAGMSLNLSISGGIICGSNVSTFRPNVTLTTDLGMSSFYWRYGYIQKVMCTQDSGARMRIPVGDSMYG